MVGSWNFGDDPALFRHGTWINPPLSYDLMVPLSDMFIEVYKPGLGNTLFSYVVFESVGDHTLIGYVQNGDTVGVVYPDEWILADVAPHNIRAELGLFPNPCGPVLNLSHNGNTEGLRIVIRDLYGREILSAPFSREVLIASLDPGVYFLLLVDPAGVAVSKQKFIHI